MDTTRPASAGLSRVDSSAMMPPCENPISATASVPTPASFCQRATVSAKAGSAASTRAGRLSSLMPCTENHWRPPPCSDSSGAAMLTTKASGNSADSTRPSGTRSSAVAPTPWNSSISCWAGPSGRATMIESDMAFSSLGDRFDGVELDHADAHRARIRACARKSASPRSPAPCACANARPPPRAGPGRTGAPSRARRAR